MLSAGLAEDSDLVLDAEMLEWADRVFVMESRHRKAVETRFGKSARSAPVVVLGIRDNYRFMDPALIRLLRAKMTPYLP